MLVGSTDAQYASAVLHGSSTGSVSAQYDRQYPAAQLLDAAAAVEAVRCAGSPFPRWRGVDHTAAALASEPTAASTAASPARIPLTVGQLELLQRSRLAWRLAASGGSAEWAEHWTENSGAIVWRADSVRRKRKHKMNKHKYRKRRKAQRHKT